jgi:hypothetical protein
MSQHVMFSGESTTMPCTVKSMESAGQWSFFSVEGGVRTTQRGLSEQMREGVSRTSDIVNGHTMRQSTRLDMFAHFPNMERSVAQ